MRLFALHTASVLFLLPTVVKSETEDLFNYRGTVGNDYGPSDWKLVRCLNHTSCPGWPDDFETYNPFIPYVENQNRCKDCNVTNTGRPCLVHTQSPIDLLRNVTESRECGDRHSMRPRAGRDCYFNKTRFAIERHVLRVYEPLDENGKSTCRRPSTIDFSWGYPIRWRLVHTDITVPSQHMQDGKAYDAEVVLSHIYTQDIENRYVGNVGIFLEKGEDSDRYDFLDLYIKTWRKLLRSIKLACRRRDVKSSNATTDKELDHQNFLRGRELAEMQEIENDGFNPYDWLIKVQTEYYFRYKGSQLVPPCFQTVHWRVMKDSIKVAPKQIDELEKLMRKRIDPVTCKKENAGRRVAGKAYFNRPMQSTKKNHRVVFCECEDWNSGLATDQEFCLLPMEERGVLPFNESLAED